MQKLVEGVHQFQNGIFSSKQRLFEGLVDGQHPLALFITCSDLQIEPSLLPQTKPSELIVLQNIGNIVAPYGAAEGAADESIEYAMSLRGVKDRHLWPFALWSYGCFARPVERREAPCRSVVTVPCGINAQDYRRELRTCHRRRRTSDGGGGGKCARPA